MLARSYVMTSLAVATASPTEIRNKDVEATWKAVLHISDEIDIHEVYSLEVVPIRRTGLCDHRCICPCATGIE